MEVGGCQASVGVQERRQHAAHVLAVAFDTLPMDEALQGAAVGLRGLEERLENDVVLFASGVVQPQHLAEQFQRFRGHALEQLELFLRHRVLPDALVALLLHHPRGTVGLALGLEHEEYRRRSVLSGIPIDRERAKAGQWRVAFRLQFVDLLGDLLHLLGGFLQPLAARVALHELDLIDKVLLQNVGGSLGGRRGKHLLAYRVPVLAGMADHLRDGGVVQAAVDGGADLEVQADLSVVLAVGLH